MAESGCLRDANFQNIDTAVLRVNNASVAVPVENTGKLTVDVAATGSIGTAAGSSAATYANSIYILAKTPSGARTIFLPALSTVSAGDKIVFVVAEQSGTGSNIVTISEATDSDTNTIFGCVTMVGGGDSVTGQKMTDLIASTGDAIGVTTIALSADTSGDDAGTEGSVLTFTCIGSTTKYWLLTGIVKTLDPGSTGATFFGA